MTVGKDASYSWQNPKILNALAQAVSGGAATGGESTSVTEPVVKAWIADAIKAAGVGGLAAAPDTSPALTTRRGTVAHGTGKFGQALTGGVIGTDDYLSATAKVGTLEAWLRDGGPDFRIAVDINGGQRLGYETTDNGGFLAASSSAQRLALSTLSLQDGQWHHVALTQDGTTAQLWVDGDPVASVEEPADFLTGGKTFAIGGNHDYAFGADWQGGIDEVRLSNVVRYTAPFTPPTQPFGFDTATVALYHLDS